MAKISILCPYGLQSKVYNLLSPLIKEKTYDMVSGECFGKLLSNKVESDSHVIETLVAVSAELYKNFFETEKIIEIGFQVKDTKADVVICYLRDMVEAEEIMMEEKVNYKNNYLLCKNADYFAANEVDLLRILKSVM